MQYPACLLLLLCVTTAKSEPDIHELLGGKLPVNNNCQTTDGRGFVTGGNDIGVLQAFAPKCPTSAATSGTKATKSPTSNPSINRRKNDTTSLVGPTTPSLTAPHRRLDLPSSNTTVAVGTQQISTGVPSTSQQIHNKSIDFSFLLECAVFPACSINKLPPEADREYTLTCNRPLVDFILAIVVILEIVIVVCNIVIIVVVAASPNLRRPHGYFKLSLAVADLINGAIVLPAVTHNILNNIHYDERDVYLAKQVKIDNSPATVVFVVAGLLSSTATLYSLLLLSVDSFLSIRWPMKYRIGEIMTTRRTVVALSFVWALALAVAALPALARDYLEYSMSLVTMFYLPHVKPLQIGDGEPQINSYLHIIIYTIAIWGIPFAATWCLTVLTWVHSRRMLLEMRDSRKQSTRNQNSLSKVDRDLRRTTTVVLLLFTITILPVFAVMLSQATNKPNSCIPLAQGNALFASMLILVCGSFLNVIVYNTCNKEFRDAARKLVKDVARHIQGDKRHFTQTGASKKSVSYWQSPAGRDFWRSRYAGDASNNSAKSLRTLSGESQSTAVTSTRTRSTSSFGSDTGKTDRPNGSSLRSVMEEASAGDIV